MALFHGNVLSFATPCPAGDIPWPVTRADMQPSFHCQSAENASDDAVKFLIANMPPWDLVNKDSLLGGIFGPTVNLSLTARTSYNWAASVPRDVFNNYVLPYANVNEVLLVDSL